MFKHYLKLAFKNQSNNRFFTVINVAGLALAIAAALFIFNYVSFEFGYDKMHSKRDRIYRVESRFYEGPNLTDDWATSSFGYGSAMAKDISGIEDYVRIGVHNTEQIVSFNDKRFRETGIGYTGASFFKVFDFKLTQGAPNDQLVRPKTVVISEDAARRYFPNENPVGKMLTFANRGSFTECEVTGVMANFPDNSHVKFSFLISYETLPDWQREFWYIHEVYTYVLLAPGINPKNIESRFPAMSEKYKTGEALKAKTWAVTLAPLSKIHLNPQKQYEREVKGNRSALALLIVVALIILLIAWINYVNIATARALDRAKDIGVRKVAGAMRRQLVGQYFTESLLLFVEATVIAVLIFLLAMPLFNNLLGLQIGYFIFSQPVVLALFGLLILTGAAITGFYPALVMTRVQPSVILKGNYSHRQGAGGLRRVLVVFQYAAALFLICGTFIVYKQVKFMQQQNIGARIDQVLVMKYPAARGDVSQQVRAFADNLKQQPYVSSVTLAGAVPGMEVAFFASNKLVGDNQQRLYEMLPVDDQFIQTFDMKLAAGRSFQQGFGNEKDNVLINEAALSNLGLKTAQEAVGKQIMLEGEVNPATISGVVKNWHQRGLGSAYTPIIFLQNGRIDWIPPRFLAVRIKGSNYESALAGISTQWKNYFPESSFDYFALDQFFDSQYKADKRFGKITALFTVLALLIALLGLWSLTSYSLSKKVKEIGVRKVHGAHISHIVYLFSKEIIVLILLSLLIAVPLSVWIMRNWLQGYAFHTRIGAGVYVLAGIIALLLAVFIISWQSYRAATRNPVEALRYE